MQKKYGNFNCKFEGAFKEEEEEEDGFLGRARRGEGGREVIRGGREVTQDIHVEDFDWGDDLT